MRWLLPCCFIFCAVALAHGEPTSEPEAYRMVCRAREAAVRLASPDALEEFERHALGYRTAFPQGPHRARIDAWLDQLRPPRACARLEADGWVGGTLDPTAANGDVTALVFFSVTHPQSAWLLPRIVAMRRRHEGLRLAGIAAVVDDRPNQTPAQLRARLVELDLPFPVAIDRQQAGGPSITFSRSGGDRLPWVVLVDRYGRVAWAGDARRADRVECRVKALLAQPRLDDVVADVRAGRRPLDALTGIRTTATVTALFDLYAEGDSAAGEALRDLGPRDYDLSRPAAARARWLRERGRYAYSYNARRVVPRD